jgi:hypothetical protein
MIKTKKKSFKIKKVSRLSLKSYKVSKQKK